MENNHIRPIHIIELKSYFNNFFKEINDSDKEGLINEKLSNTDDEIRLLLNYSILTGENYLVTKEYIESIKKDFISFKEDFKEILISIKVNTQTQERLNRKVTEIDNFLTLRLEEYKELIQYTQVKNNNKSFPITEYDVNHLISIAQKKSISVSSSELNILLAKLDHDYHSGDAIENNLKRIYEFLKVKTITKTDPVLGILKDKANFLLYKILVRREKTYRKRSSELDNTKLDKLQNSIANKKEEIGYYKKFIDEIDSINKGDSNTLISYFDFHKKSKEYRKNSNFRAINILIAKFKTSYEYKVRKENNFEKIAYANMLVFLETQKFRAELSKFENNLFEKQKTSIEDIEFQFNNIYKSFKEFVKLSKHRKSYRFVTEFNKTIKKILNKINNKLDIKGYVIQEAEIELIKTIRNSFYESVDIFFTHYQWSYEKRFIPIYTPFQSCRHETDIITISIPERNGDKTKENKINLNLFIDSAYVLPLNFLKNKHNFELLVNENKNLLSDIHFKLSERNSLNFEEKANIIIKKTQLNSIQVIAIFAALITFITTSSAAFTSQSLNPQSVAIVFLSLSFGFAIFTLLLDLIVVGNNRYKIWGFILFLIAFVFLAYYHPNYLSKEVSKKDTIVNNDSIPPIKTIKFNQ